MLSIMGFIRNLIAKLAKYEVTKDPGFVNMQKAVEALKTGNSKLTESLLTHQVIPALEIKRRGISSMNIEESFKNMSPAQKGGLLSSIKSTAAEVRRESPALADAVEKLLDPIDGKKLSGLEDFLGNALKYIRFCLEKLQDKPEEAQKNLEMGMVNYRAAEPLMVRAVWSPVVYK